MTMDETPGEATGHAGGAPPTLRRNARTPVASRGLVRLLALTYGLTIANLYYCQLLPRMAESYPTSSAVVHLTTAGQPGARPALGPGDGLQGVQNW
ncbi:hypothetical protein [Actinomadura sp. 6N118]|uniref:hypothetical protein n=1 Tax=Actinomadura sp. 6N118 TaxID=3375151 RepID=UPI0037B4A38E